MNSQLPKSDGRALPPTPCAWREPSGIDVHGALWATPACVCFTAQLFGFGTRQLMPIAQLAGARRRGSDGSLIFFCVFEISM